MDQQRTRRKQMSPLARHRAARGFTQKDLAAVMQVEPSTVHSWEAGKYRPEPSKYAKLAQFLGVEPLQVAELIDQCPQQGA